MVKDSVKTKNYGFRLHLQEEQVAYNPIIEFSFSRSYAYDCTAFFRNHQTITLIDVITRYQFDNTHPGGTSVGDYLLPRPGNFYNYYPHYQYRPLNDNLPFLNDNQDKSIHNNNPDLTFKTLSPVNGPHRFIVTVSF